MHFISPCIIPYGWWVFFRSDIKHLIFQLVPLSRHLVCKATSHQSAMCVCTCHSLPACRTSFVVCCSIAWRKPLCRVVLKQGQTAPPLFLSSQVRAEVENVLTKGPIYIRKRYSAMLTRCLLPPTPPSSTSVILEDIKKEKNGGSHCWIFPSVCSERKGWRLLCVHSIMIHPFVRVSTVSVFPTSLFNDSGDETGAEQSW